MKKVFIILSLLVAGFSVSAQKVSYATELGKTAMGLWKDSLTTDPSKPAKWSYDQGVVLKGVEGLWNNTGDGDYFRYIKNCMDVFVDKTGSIRSYKLSDFNIDNVNNGRILLLLYKVTNDERYWKAATQLWEQLKDQPRNSQGGFWHKKIYPDQMWLDGLYMGEPFYAEYASMIHDDTAFNDIAKQFILAEKQTRDPKTGLLYHAWDESKKEKWANKNTGLSQNFWGRAMGWYGMALVDVLDYFPADHPQQKKLLEILKRFASAIVKVQDAKTGLWWDVLNLPDYKNNYTEASASSMFVYTLAKAVRMGYLPATYLNAAKKGYNGIIKKFLVEKNGQWNLEGTVSVSGLGGNPYRDGSFDYYMSEKVVENDAKGVGAFIQAANEMEMLNTLSYGKGKTVLLDCFFNHETKKDVTGKEAPFHYIWNELDNGGYSMFGKIFDRYGVKKESLDESVTAEKLKGKNIYIIVDPDWIGENPHPNYVEPKNIDAIYNWVKAGGVLLLFTNDSANAEFEHFNKLTERFGIHFDENSKNHVQGNKYEQGAIEIPAGNSIFKNENKVYIKELSTIAVKSPASILLKNRNDNIVAVSKVGKGIVFAVGDPWFYNEYLDGRKLPPEFQNYPAAVDLVKWAIDQIKN